MTARRRILGALVLGLAATAGLAGTAQAAPQRSVVYSSSTGLPADFAVALGSISFVLCGHRDTVTVNGTSGALPYPSCGGHVDTRGGIAYGYDRETFGLAQTTHLPGHATSFWADSRVYFNGKQANVSNVEKDLNPDAGATYGTTSSDPCVQAAVGSYGDRLESSLSALASGPGNWYTADREGNTIYRVTDAGQLGILAVLPPVKVKVTEALAVSQGWPTCVVGTKVAFEAAPTSVEVAADKSVYVSGLPMLGSTRSLGRSVIYKINPTTGKIKTLPQHYRGRVDLATGTRGRLFVARLDSEKISVIKNGRSSTYTKLAKVLSVETDEYGRLYAAQGARTGADAHDADVVRFDHSSKGPFPGA